MFRSIKSCQRFLCFRFVGFGKFLSGNYHAQVGGFFAFGALRVLIAFRLFREAVISRITLISTFVAIFLSVKQTTCEH